MSECKHGLEQSWCADCTGRDGRSAPTTFTGDVRAVIASFPGDCYECLEPFDEGDEIAHNGNGWIAACCEHTLPDPLDDFR